MMDGLDGVTAADSWWRRALVLVPLLLLMVGCDGGEGAGTEADDGRYTIVATTGMITDVAARIAGDRAEVVGLMGSGIDPHLYKPTRSDIQKVIDADLVFYNGLLLEGKMTDSLTRAKAAGKPVFALGDELDPSFLLEPEEMQGHYDPHVWMDPSAWAKVAEGIRDHLIAYDPAGEAIYRANAEDVLADIAELDAYAERVLSSVPEQQRVLVTAHDAFNYFGRRFDYDVVGIQGLSTESEAGVQDIERLVDLLVDRKVAAVFIESTVSERNIRALVNGARARGHTVVIGGSLFSDAMGKQGTYEGTYVGMIDHNASTIARALGGDVPEGGLRGMREETP